MVPVDLKTKKRILASLLAVTVPVGIREVKPFSYYQDMIEDMSGSKRPEQEANFSNWHFYTDDPYEDLNLYEAKMLMKQNLIQEFLDYYENLSICYYDNHIHSSKEEIKDFLQSAQNEQACDYQYDGNEEALILKINENSQNFSASHPEYVSIFEGEDENVSRLVFSRALSLILTNSFNNTNEDICRFQNLKVVFGNVNESYEQQGLNVFTFFYDAENNLLVLDENAMERVSIVERITYLEEFGHVLLHGLNRARMYSCSHHSNEVFSIPSSLLINNASETELYYSEKDQTGYLNHAGNLVYDRQLNHEALLLLLGIFQENFSMEEYYRAICNGDVIAFQSLFGVESEEEAVEFYRILESIDFAFYGNESSQGMTMKDTIKEAGMGYRAKIFQKFLISMLHYKEEHIDFSLEEQLLFLAIARNLVIQNTEYYEDGELRYDETFVKTVYEMEEQYISFLSQYYERSIDGIRYYDGENDSIIKELELFYTEHRETYQVKRLFLKYPVLSVICYENRCSAVDYRDFLRENDLEMKRTIQQGDL